MLKILGATAQSLVALQARCPGFVRSCIRYYQPQRAYDFVSRVSFFERLCRCYVLDVSSEDLALHGVDPSLECGTILCSAVFTTM
jgi:hypothetical protein